MIGMGGDPVGFELLIGAARGNVDAQRGLIWHASELANEGKVKADRALVFAEPFARILAATTGADDDKLMLAYILGSLADVAREEGRGEDALCLEAEYIAILNDLADTGNEEVGRLIVVHGDELDPEALKLASALNSHSAITVETIH